MRTANKSPSAFLIYFARIHTNKKATDFSVAVNGSPSWTRTSDTAVNSRVLYRLSYGGISRAFTCSKCYAGIDQFSQIKMIKYRRRERA